MPSSVGVWVCFVVTNAFVSRGVGVFFTPNVSKSTYMYAIWTNVDTGGNMENRDALNSVITLNGIHVYSDWTRIPVD